MLEKKAHQGRKKKLLLLLDALLVLLQRKLWDQNVKGDKGGLAMVDFTKKTSKITKQKQTNNKKIKI